MARCAAAPSTLPAAYLAPLAPPSPTPASLPALLLAPAIASRSLRSGASLHAIGAGWSPLPAPTKRSSLAQRGARSRITSSPGDARDEFFPSPPVPVVKERFDSCVQVCYDPDFDLHLITRLIELMGVRARFSLTFALSKQFGATPSEVEKAVRLMLRCLKLLHRCGYQREDIELMVAHSSRYLRDYMVAVARDGQPPMEIGEIAHIFCVLMFIAHSYVQDENCPLHVWHQHLFAKYCSLGTLNSAVMRLLEKLSFALRVEEHQLVDCLAFLKDTWEVESPKQAVPQAKKAKR